ncbi:MAG: hypothetical protein LZF86_120028 [Nitrospira sp.]|nr:MAG: hypothetical protein LZF86_120028 [Nitrospira sp.]
MRRTSRMLKSAVSGVLASHRTLPSPKDVLRYGERWRPYRTVAAWALWRAVDLAKRTPPDPGAISSLR